MKISMKVLSKLAMNAEPLKDKIIYRGFVDESLDKDIDYNFDSETLVMITPIGQFVGSSTDGKPTTEIIDEESVIKMAKQTEEILLDKDHASMRGPEDRDTTAYGWISGLKAITGLGNMSGLYGTIKWVGEGIKLAKERIYRFLSPVFELDNDGRAIKLVNVALTNRPALPLPPIINSEAKDETKISITNSKKDTDNMNKDEIVTMIKEIVQTTIASNSTPVTEEVKEVKVDEEKKEEISETKNEEVKVEETKTEDKPVEEAKNEDVHVDIITEEKKDDVKVEEIKNEDVTEEEKKEEEKEVIKPETLNSTPTIGTDISGKSAWMNLKGEEFFKYLKAHPELRG